MKKALIAGVGTAAFAAIAPALAQTPPAAPAPAVAPHGAPRAAMMRDHTRDEVVAKVREHFARLDANRDGFVTKAEADAARVQMKAKFSADRSERVEHRKERVAMNREHTFERLDANNDGSISRQEFDAAHAQRDTRIASRGDDAARNGRMIRGIMMGSMHAMHGRLFEMADVNKDGRVSLQEAQDSALRHFDTADVNKDGRITREERIQQFRQHRRS